MWWYEEYEKLDLHGVEITFISDDDQDMIEINYPDGVSVDVGYMEEEKTYYITVVDEKVGGWTNPVSVVAITDKSKLFDSIQEVIYELQFS